MLVLWSQRDLILTIAIVVVIITPELYIFRQAELFCSAINVPFSSLCLCLRCSFPFSLPRLLCPLILCTQGKLSSVPCESPLSPAHQSQHWPTALRLSGSRLPHPLPPATPGLTPGLQLCPLVWNRRTQPKVQPTVGA